MHTEPASPPPVKAIRRRFALVVEPQGADPELALKVLWRHFQIKAIDVRPAASQPQPQEETP